MRVLFRIRRVATCIATFLAMYAPTCLAAGWIGPYPVTYIEVGDGNIYFMLNEHGTETYNTGLSCTNTAILFQGINAKDALATGLSARATGLKVKFYVTGCNVYAVATKISSDPNW